VNRWHSSGIGFPVLAFCALALVCLAAGCGPRAAPSPAPPRPAAPRPVLRGPWQRTWNLKGLLVGASVVTSAAPDLLGRNSGPPVRTGRHRFIVLAQAVNSSETALDVQIKHNFPDVSDLNHKYLRATDGYLTGRPGGESATPSPSMLGPSDSLGRGGLLKTAQVFKRTPGQGEVMFEWRLGEAGLARGRLALPPGRP
jgi:hypothetical protein